MTAAHTHVFQGPHPEVLADGTPVAIGALASPDPTSPHDAAMIARGWFVTREDHDNANATDPPSDDEPSLADLQAEAGSLGIAKSGTKAEIAARIIEHKLRTSSEEEKS